MKHTPKPYRKYTTLQIHNLLCDKLISREDVSLDQSAFLCPYYVPLSGALGFDWGVIVNLESPRFGQLVFEHDSCGCTNHPHQYGNQRGTSWMAGQPESQDDDEL